MIWESEMSCTNEASKRKTKATRVAIAGTFGVLLLFGTSCDVGSLALCMEQHTRQTCINKALLKSEPQCHLPKDSPVQGRSTLYHLTPTTENWRHLWPKTQRKEDLALFHQSGKAHLEVLIDPPIADTPQKRAKELLQPFAKTNKKPPSSLFLDNSVWASEGAVFSLCSSSYFSNQECIYSGIYPLQEKTIRIFATGPAAGEERTQLEQLLNSFRPDKDNLTG